MTSQAQPHGHVHTLDRGEPYYTNEDVALLHNIVTHAQKLLPSLPPRERVATSALFNAYYAILPAVGIDADHDNRYARVLFKIGGMQRPGNLYEKFEAVLARMGIAIQVDHEEHTEGSVNAPRESQLEATYTKTASELGRINTPGRRRRNSDSTIWDFVPEPDRSAKHPRSHSVLGRDANDNIASPKQRQRKTSWRTEHDTRRAQKPMLRSSRDIGAWMNDTVDAGPLTASSSIAGSITSLRRQIPVHYQRSEAYTDDISSASEDFNDTQDGDYTAAVDDEPIVNSVAENDFVMPDSATVLDIKASMIRAHFLRTRLSACLNTWRHRFASLQRDYLIAAVYHDTQTLQRQALTIWVARLKLRQRQSELRKYHGEIDQKAVRLRQVYLLEKAFTIWSQKTAVQIELTNAARQHVVWYRVFTAWKEMTQQNESSVNHFVLAKFFCKWHRRHINTIVASNNVVAQYQEDLVRRNYRIWFWAFCNQRAPIWYALCAKKRALQSWTSALRRLRANEAAASDCSVFTTQSRPLHIWTEKATQYVGYRHTAKRQYHQNLCIRSLVKWNSESALLPARFQIQIRVAARLKRDCFALWRLRTYQQRIASVLDADKISREAITVWSMSLRQREIQMQIDDRCIRHAMYRWVIATRLHEVLRVRENDLARRAMATFRGRQVFLQRTDKEASAVAWRFYSENLAASSFHSMRVAFADRLQRKAIAHSVYAPRIVSEAFHQWSVALRIERERNSEAAAARRRFIIRRSIRRWRAAMQRSKQLKRREAYALFRRNLKIALARRVIGIWHIRLGEIEEARERAAELRNNKLVKIGMSVFDDWRAEAARVSMLQEQLRHTTLGRNFVQWRKKLANVQDLSLSGDSFYAEHLLAGSLKRWMRQTLQISARESVVTALRHKVQRKTSRRILLYWRLRTPLSSQTTEVDDAGTAIDTEAYRMSKFGDTINNIETWSEYGENGEEGDVESWRRDTAAATADTHARGSLIAISGMAMSEMPSTPIPGYLNTPSKQAQRSRFAFAGRHPNSANARIIGSTTPAAVLSTPFERLLREQYVGGSRSAGPAVQQINTQYAGGNLASFRRNREGQADARRAADLGGGFADLPGRTSRNGESGFAGLADVRQ